MVERTFRLPDLGEGIAEGELVSWAVAPGDTVEEDQVLAEVETDKALVEIPSPYDGTVTELHAAEGEVVPVDSVIVSFEVEAADAGTTPEAGEAGAQAVEPTEVAETEGASEDERAAASGPVGETAGTPREAGETAGAPPAKGTADVESASGGGRVFATPSTRRLARDLGVDLSAVAGSEPGGRVSEADVRAAAEESDEAAESAEAAEESGEAAVTEPIPIEAAETSAEPTAVERAGATRERTLAMPATRRLAGELGVDLDAVPASEEREGEPFVTPEDVRAFAERGEAAGGAEAVAATDAAAGAESAVEAEAAGAGEPSSAAGEAEATAGSGAEAAGGTAAAAGGERVPYRGIRRTIGEHMVRSAYTAPHVSHHDEFDVADLVAVREELAAAAEREGVKLTYLPFAVKAVTTALREFPYLNASLDEEAEEIVLHDEYNVGVAVDTEAGLMVPVVKHADRKGLLQLASEVADLAARARERKLSRSEMQGGTFTITNVGGIGGEYFSPIINYPEAAILGMGPIKKRPWVVDDEVVARETMTLSMSVDHRIVDGAVAARFTNRVEELLGNPTRLLLE